MIRYLFLISFLLLSPILQLQAQSADDIDDETTLIAETLAFARFINYSLVEIKNTHPSLSSKVDEAYRDFNKYHGGAIQKLNDYMADYLGMSQRELDIYFEGYAKRAIGDEEVSILEARDFLYDFENMFIKGKDDTSENYVYVLLHLNDNYNKNPEFEFIDGFTEILSTRYLPNSHRLDLSIEHPYTWDYMDVSGTQATVMITSIDEDNAVGITIQDLLAGSNIDKRDLTEEDIEYLESVDFRDEVFGEMKAPVSNKQFLKGAGFGNLREFSHRVVTIENNPAIELKTYGDSWFNFIERDFHMTYYIVFYKHYLVHLMFMTMEGDEPLSTNIEKYEKLNNLILKSFHIEGIRER